MYRVFLENVLKTELNNARIDACAVDLAKRCAPYRGIGISELRRIKGIVKFSPELKVMPLSYRCVFNDGNIPVILAGTKNDPHTRTAPTGAVAVDSACRRAAERARVEVFIQSILDIPGRQDVVAGHIGTHLGSAAARPINGAGGTVRESEGQTALDGRDSGNRPSIDEFSLNSRMRPERQIILVVQDKAMRPVPSGRPVLLFQIQGVIGIRAVPRTEIGEVFTERVGCLQRQSIGKRLAYRGLKAVVVGIAVEIRSRQSGRLIPEMRNPQTDVLGRIGDLAVYRISGVAS